MRTLVLARNLGERLGGYARRAYPQEACGVLLGKSAGDDRIVISVHQARNLNAERPRDRYELDPGDFLAADEEARKTGLDIVGIWHTHPDHPAQPSSTDRAAAWPGWSYVIVSVSCDGVGDVRSWCLSDDRFEEEAIRS
ncbi:MAG: hypothetical protein A3G25_16850 [Betaproteobacteria bacterium RIFCSPLOWO2_12_FULL_63_13]|nr:MAG: hypothetical protein A3G25_16850 [Betaproteobacteria bacterium RIFCSPLOWO2_12_FULL_63_13]